MDPALFILSVRARMLFLYTMTGPGSFSSNSRARMIWWKALGVTDARPRMRNIVLFGKPLRQPPELLLFRPKKTGYFFADTAKGCDMDTLYNEEAASPPGKH